MSKETRDILTDLLIAVVVLFASLPFFCAVHCKPDEVVKTDTVYVYDTIRIVEPVPIKEEVVGEEVVKLPKAKSELKDELKSEPNDSARLINEVSRTEREDSVAVIAPISEKVYDDSLYRAVVRGYNPELVSLDIYNTTKYYPVVEKVKVKPKIAISAGVYGGFGSKGADYGLGIMVGVPILAW